jgi:hypothetical protein
MLKMVLGILLVLLSATGALLLPAAVAVPDAELLPAVMQMLAAHGRPFSSRYSGNGAFLKSFLALYPTW